MARRGAAGASPGGRAPYPAPSDSDDESLRRELRVQVARFCPPRLVGHLDDIVQVAWLRLRDVQRKNERNRDPGTSLIARVAYCATMDEIRRQRRRREVPVDEAATVSPVATDPSQAAAASEIGREIRHCLTRLLPSRRRAVALYLQGHTAPETGRLLGWPLKRAENMIFRGMADLRRCLTAKGITP